MPHVTRWLLLRGLARTAWHWGDFPERLRERLGAEQVLCLDLPSIDQAKHRRPPHSVGGIMADVRQRWLEVAGSRVNASPSPHPSAGSSSDSSTDSSPRSPSLAPPPGPWGVVGQSLGGMVAISWCHHHPADFAAAVVINTSAANLSSPFRRFSLAALPTALAALASSSPQRRERTVMALTSNSRDERERARILAAWVDHARAAPVARSTFLAQLWAASRYRLPSALATPLLVLTSQGDRLVNVDCSRRVATALHASLVEHTWAGHDLPLDDPEWVLQQINEWIAGQRGRRGLDQSSLLI